SDSEISTLLDMAGRTGNATGVALFHNSVRFGVPSDGPLREKLANSDILAVSTLVQGEFTQQLLVDSPYELNYHTLGV
ncbi:cellulose biosynthesis cyclic di-GMP-binding regulatory protein BcsB, partial [Erwinia amylovora]|uniref:cellulose biosynthesis cyclic di-GMP-binding regulatory protein BcsB n=1 Tax=Erwinia amylovora TaxID=552 RepID=UPI00200A573F